MIRYEIVDLFADHADAGSPLGVVLDAEGLSGPTMQAVARELGTPETAFVLPPDDARATHRVRVFTPQRESPFGGHSAVGTATVLHRRGALPPGPAVQQCGDRLLPLTVGADGVTMAGRDALPVTVVEAGPLLRALSLSPADLTGPVRAAGFGPAFHFLPTTPEAMDRARLDAADPVWAAIGDAFLHSWDGPGRTARARMFAPGYGIPEDPACASAALALGVALVDAGLLPRTDGEHAFRVRQGSHAGRPATLRATATVTGGRVAGGTVTGTAVPVGGGELAPPTRLP